jgi:hypothetical protein
MYGKSNLCPCCRTSVETLQHVFCCQEEEATTHHNVAKLQLETSLSNNTPIKIVQSLLHGLSQREAYQCGDITSLTSLFCSFVSPVDTLLTQAFHSQTSIRWDQLLRGRLSKSWDIAYKYIINSKQPGEISQSSWGKTVIIHL